MNRMYGPMNGPMDQITGGEWTCASLSDGGVRERQSHGGSGGAVGERSARVSVPLEEDSGGMNHESPLKKKKRPPRGCA